MLLGYGLRKLARDLGLEVKNGVACGIFEGYAVSMWEGLGSKTFCISAKFDEGLSKKLEKDFCDLEYKYRRLGYIGFTDGIYLRGDFTDNPGTMSQFRNCFLDVLSLLEHYDIPDADICPKCGLPMYGQGVWSMYNLYGDQACLYAHEHCAAAMEREINQYIEKSREHPISKEEYIEVLKKAHEDLSTEEAEKIYAEYVGDTKKEPRPGERYLPGWIGALGGCILGAVILAAAIAVVGSRGILISFVLGLLIQAGYNATRDVRGKKKALTVIFMTLLCVCLGTVLGAVFDYAIAANRYDTMPKGLSFVNRCKDYISFGWKTFILDKDTYLAYMLGAGLFSMLGLLEDFFELFMGNGDEKMRRKHLRKRK